jgi:PAS domain S-box-containing protein
MGRKSAVSAADEDVLIAFELAPIGLCLTRNRIIRRCNSRFAEMFGYPVEELTNRSLECLYPSRDEFEHMGAKGLPLMKTTGSYSDERIMRHRDGHLFWCHVSGRSLDRAHPYACAAWLFEDLSVRRSLAAAFTRREREIAHLLTTGKTSKQMAKALSLSPRTVEAHRARLMRKLNACTPAEMIARLVGLN